MAQADPKAPVETVPRVLVVDDEPAVLEVLKVVLGRAQCQVTTAETAQAAREILEQEPTAFDCVITDAVMPDETGYDLVRALRAESRFARLPVLMLTRKRHRKDVKLAVEAGVTDYVLKPIDAALLLEKLKACLAKRGR
jgi:DNA-binding response OmpR family regulator